jgi:flagellar motility protein MotE (MotC chaperone)
VLTYIALLLLAAGPVEPAPPKIPAVPEVKAPAVEPRAELPSDRRLDGGLGEKAVDAKAAGVEPKPAAVDRQASEPAERAATRPDAGVAEAPPVPPALTRKALCGEFVKSGKELAQARRRLDDEKKALEQERAALEKLKIEIADSRIHLRAETERLEKLLARRSEAAATEGEKPAAAPERSKPPAPAVRPQELDSLARTIKSMKPEAAAALIQRTDTPLAAAVLKRMKAADAGAVMDRLKPDLAAELMAVMATLPSGPPAKVGKP